MSGKGFLPHEHGIKARIEREKSQGNIFDLDEKIIMLGEKNLEKLKGYKASVILKSVICTDRAEIHIVITGHTRKFANNFFDSLEAMKPEEVNGFNG